MSTRQKKGIEGIEYLPEPILKYIRRKVHNRVYLPHVYHVTELTGCLRKAFFHRVFGYTEIPLNSAWWFYRGSLFDGEWSPLFEKNQETKAVARDGLIIVGTYDFVFQNKKLGDTEPVVHDLKSTQSLYYLREEDIPHRSHVEQVQAYMMMFGYNKGRIIYYDFSDSPIQFDVEKDEKILDKLFERAKILDDAVNRKDPSAIPFPEESYFCKEKYCDVRRQCIRDQMIRKIASEGS